MMEEEFEDLLDRVLSEKRGGGGDNILDEPYSMYLTRESSKYAFPERDYKPSRCGEKVKQNLSGKLSLQKLSHRSLCATFYIPPEVETDLIIDANQNGQAWSHYRNQLFINGGT